MTSVELRSVEKSYGPVRAVKQIDLDIRDGEFIVLLGPSGCGKTTTLRCIAGLETISGGEIRLDNEVVSSTTRMVPAEDRLIGMVFQSYAIWPHMTVAENVAFGLKLKKLSRSEVATRVRQSLDLVGLGAYGDRSASQLSGGQQQRVALARATALEPKVLLFDEPLSNLDAKLRDRMRFELNQLHRRLGITSVYVTHDQQEALVIADRIVLMNDGQIDQIGTPVEIYQNPRSRFGAEFIGIANIWDGEVIDGDAQSTKVRLSNGFLLTANVRRPETKAVDVMVRPEQLKLARVKDERANAMQAQVSSSYFLGNLSDVSLESGTLPVRAQVSPPELFQEGENVWLFIPAEAIRLLNCS